MICDVLPTLDAPAFGTEAPSALCAWAAIDLAGRAMLAFPDVGISRTLTLPRARASGGLQLGQDAGARLAVAVVRSGGEAGYIGVDGEALVPEVQIAEARAALPAWGLGLGAGLIDDPWVVSGDVAWGLRAIAPGAGEAAGWMDSSDLGGWVGWTAPRDLVSLRVDLTTGEGARFRERNEGKDLAGTVTVRPIGDRLVVTAYARDGSRGLGLARDHRAGLRISGQVGPVHAGAEGLMAWGVGGDATREPIGGSAWLVARPWGPLLGYARLDLASESLADGEAGTGTLLAGVGVGLPSPSFSPVQIVVGYSGTRVGSAVAELAGGEALDNVDAVFLQLGVALSTTDAKLSHARNGAVPSDR